MMLNEPMSSSSQWRIPTASPRSDDSPGLDCASEAESFVATAARTGASAISSAAGAARGIAPTFFLALLVGGVFAAPAMALFALTSLFMPFASVRAIAPTLIGLSLVWLTVAILGAHIQPERMTRRSEATESANPRK